MQTTNIQWADYSWNPATGCEKRGPECRNCYAEQLHHVWAQREEPPEYVSGKEWSIENAEANVQVHEDRLDDPSEHSVSEPSSVFVGSMTDMFHRHVGAEFAQRVLDECSEHPEHLWLFLTKRPENAAAWRLDWPTNAMLGVSVGSGPGGEYPDTTHRIEQLRDVDVSRKWVSFEPLIEPIGDVDLDHIDWAVVGGETGSKDDRREMDHAWACDLLQQCREADVRFFFKQSSGPRPGMGEKLRVRDDDGSITKFEIRETPPLPETSGGPEKEP